jgi:hypothetical protein
MAPLPSENHEESPRPSALETATTFAATIGVCALVYRGFQFVMEKTVSYIARRKLQAILKKFEEEAKKAQEAQGVIKPMEVQQSVDGTMARRLLKRNIGETAAKVVASRWN